MKSLSAINAENGGSKAMKNILFASSECVPFIKTGGLADVVGSLPKEFSRERYDVRVVIPNYTCMKQEWNGLDSENQLCFPG